MSYGEKYGYNYGYDQCCEPYGYGYGYGHHCGGGGGKGFALIVVLFILLIIVGASWFSGGIEEGPDCGGYQGPGPGPKK
ncbi:hypothetical protein BleG1_2404 [Shouchella lehensis G1]|uniref:YjcZ family sporulation protein n=3 Tax=Bacillaceae TaxID=186817 RepID=A0A060LXQ2_9BACI|nr:MULTISPECIES: YjcZ family sporulation protein [Bacillaceae]RQW20814.1 YjcZ family sporulation protein [Bacillus sp. C1-1]AIC94982.1 hypothetical protein BleG1_2404 [Shouchella lehensis G1]KQL58098.1 hypothetical protein AN965_04795 [Alkalicoccobacillus plakortidis]MBG9784175.1 hypothetical protein [Shouchella lehensis]TES50839.1 YjcZ family sporulation protein [Shouchella lehensis]